MSDGLSSTFQSTLPVRGATILPRKDRPSDTISIHAPRAGSDGRSTCGVNIVMTFQSTLPVRGATVETETARPDTKFQSTLPVRGATEQTDITGDDQIISIHAPRAGSDKAAGYTDTELENFNPRSPCGERLNRDHGRSICGVFQSTLPVRGATKNA